MASALVMTGSGGATKVSTSVSESVPVVFVAEMVTLKSPSKLVVPEMRPVAVFTERPSGRPVASNDAGLFAAVIW